MDQNPSTLLSTAREFFGRISNPRLLAGVAAVTTWVMVATVRNQHQLESMVASLLQNAVAMRDDTLALSERGPNFLPLIEHELGPGQKCKLVAVSRSENKTAFSLQMRLPLEVSQQLGGLTKPAAMQVNLVSTNPKFEPSTTTYLDLVDALSEVNSKLSPTLAPRGR